MIHVKEDELLSGLELIVNTYMGCVNSLTGDDEEASCSPFVKINVNAANDIANKNNTEAGQTAD